MFLPRSYSPDSFQNILEQTHNIHTLLVLKYDKRSHKLRMWCRTCTRQFEVGRQWMHNSQLECPLCKSDTIRLEIFDRALKKREEYRQRFNIRLQPRGIRLAYPFVGAVFKHSFRCEQNHTWSASLQDVVYRNQGCPTCSKTVPEAPLQPEARPFPLPIPAKIHGLKKFLNAKPTLPVVPV